MGITHSKKGNTTAEIEDKKRQIEEEERPWPDLLPELVFSIVESLSLLDRFNVSFAFPKWKPTMGLVPSMPSLLQITNFDSKYSTFKIRDPITGTFIETCCLPYRVTLLSSSYGWLLLSNYELFTVFFLNPLSKAVIRLPPIEPPYSLSACFSAPPTSPECVIFLGQFGADAIRIMFCYHGDNIWTELFFDNKESRMLLSAYEVNSVFYKGKVYWLGMDGRIGVFDPVAKSWIVHGSSDFLGGYNRYYLLVQSGDDLFRIWTCCVDFHPTVSVYKLEKHGYQWKETRSLDGHSFFISFYPSIIFSTEALQEKDRDKIYIRSSNGKYCFVYDVGSARILNRTNIFLKQPSFNCCCWIQPKWDYPSFEQLRWF